MKIAKKKRIRRFPAISNFHTPRNEDISMIKNFRASFSIDLNGSEFGKAENAFTVFGEWRTTMKTSPRKPCNVIGEILAHV